MALHGTITYNGLKGPAYVNIGNVGIDKTTKYATPEDEAELINPVRTYYARFQYFLRSSPNEQHFAVYSDSIQVDLDKNIYEQIYEHLSVVLNIENIEA